MDLSIHLWNADPYSVNSLTHPVYRWQASRHSSWTYQSMCGTLIHTLWFSRPLFNKRAARSMAVLWRGVVARSMAVSLRGVAARSMVVL